MTDRKAKLVIHKFLVSQTYNFPGQNFNSCNNLNFTIHSRINRINILIARLKNKFVGWNISFSTHTSQQRLPMVPNEDGLVVYNHFFGGVGAHCKTRGDYSPPDRSLILMLSWLEFWLVLWNTTRWVEIARSHPDGSLILGDRDGWGKIG